MKAGRNDLCPCGSGKKYKHCCWANDQLAKPAKGHEVSYNKRYNRFESALDHQYAPFNYGSYLYTDSKPYSGKVKCRLLHTAGNSIVMPDFIFLDNGWIQPLHFIAPLLFKLDEKTTGCDIFIDIQNGETIKVRFYNHGYICTYSDNSQLFECEIYGPEDIEEFECGDFKSTGNQIDLNLFHHTNQKGNEGITASKTLRSSRWNYRGNKECVNFHFAYFTHIPEMKHSSDLITVAMSKDGNIDYMIDSFVPPAYFDKNYRTTYKDSIFTAEVYRSTTTDRNKHLSFYVPVDAIDIKHLYAHEQGGRVFYEVCFPYIHRIKMSPNTALHFDSDYRIEKEDSIVISEYSIIGDARFKEGLAAPFEEEETKYIFKIEDCGSITIPDFWFANGNTDLFSNKNVEAMEMKNVSINPTT